MCPLLPELVFSGHGCPLVVGMRQGLWGRRAVHPGGRPVTAGTAAAGRRGARALVSRPPQGRGGVARGRGQAPCAGGAAASHVTAPPSAARGTEAAGAAGAGRGRGRPGPVRLALRILSWRRRHLLKRSPNMATRSSRREPRLPVLLALVALLPPGALGAGWTPARLGGRAPSPQDRGFLVVQGDPREAPLRARGDPRGVGEKPRRRPRSAALQPEPIEVYGQVSARTPPSSRPRPQFLAPHPSFAGPPRCRRRRRLPCIPPPPSRGSRTARAPRRLGLWQRRSRRPSGAAHVSGERRRAQPHFPRARTGLRGAGAGRARGCGTARPGLRALAATAGAALTGKLAPRCSREGLGRVRFRPPPPPRQHNPLHFGWEYPS